MIACERSALIEAMIDDRLGPHERASVERHLKTCEQCAELASELSQLRSALRAAPRAISALDHQRARLQLLRQSATTTSKKRRPAALLVAAWLLLPLAAWAATPSGWPLSLLENARQAPTAPEPPRTRAADSGVRQAPLQPPAAEPEPPQAAPVEPAPSPPPAAARSLERAHQRSNRPAPPSASQAGLDFADAMAALARGDFSAGASQLESFVAKHAHDARVEDAMYLRAIALQRAGRMSEAVIAARSYLATYPNGDHRTQAQHIARE